MISLAFERVGGARPTDQARHQENFPGASIARATETAYLVAAGGSYVPTRGHHEWESSATASNQRPNHGVACRTCCVPRLRGAAGCWATSMEGEMIGRGFVAAMILAAGLSRATADDADRNVQS